MSKLVSVIIPAYNVENYIEDCVKSILNQTHQNIEILIYNDGSTDGTLNKLKKLVKNKKVLVFNSKKNKGASAARNFLFDKAKGDYIMLQDSDDVSRKRRIEVCLNYLESSDFIFTSCNIETSENHRFQYHMKDEFMTAIRQFQCHKPMGGASSFFDRCVIDAGIRYDETLLAGEDVLFDAEVQGMFPLKMRGLPDNYPYYWYRKREGSLTSIRREAELTPPAIMEKRNKKIKNAMHIVVLENKEIFMEYFKKEPNLYVDELRSFYEKNSETYSGI